MTRGTGTDEETALRFAAELSDAAAKGKPVEVRSDPSPTGGTEGSRLVLRRE